MIQVTEDVASLGRRLDDLVHGLLRRLRVLERAELGCCGVTLAQGALLRALAARDAAQMGDVADRLGVAPSTATRLVLPLERRGLVRRTAMESDGRAVCVSLTQRGSDLARRIAGGGRRQAAAILERIRDERRGQVLDSLAELVDAVDGCCGTPEDSCG